MDRVFGRSVGLIGLTLLTTPLLVGCAALQNRVCDTIDKVDLKGGDRIELSWDVRSDLFTRSQRAVLSIDNDDELEKYETVVAADVAKDDLALRADAEHRRAWVLDRRQNAVLLSVDFQNEQVWQDQNDQPEWATRE